MTEKRIRVWTIKPCRKADGQTGQDLEKEAREQHPEWAVSRPHGQCEAFIIIDEKAS